MVGIMILSFNIIGAVFNFYQFVSKSFVVMRYCMRKPKTFRNKVVVITGGAMGFGNMIAMRMYEEGATVYVWDIYKDGIARCNKIHPGRLGGSIKGRMINICDKQKIDIEAQHILKEHGRVDIFIHAADGMAGKPLL